jgi:hypothetical protein
MKEELKKHPAFKGTSKLELLGKKYGIDVIFVMDLIRILTVINLYVN